MAEKAAAAGHRARRRRRPRGSTERVKELEHGGYQFEAADGSFELLMRKEAGEYEPLFRLESWRCIVEKRADGKVETEATIKIWVDGERYVRTAEGNGPVHALDRALRDAIGEIHPHLKDIELVNFKVRILDETKGTDAVTRVLLDASDGHDMWGSIGVSENIIAASWEALVDSLEYGMQPGAPPADRACRVIPLAQPRHSARARRSSCSRCCAPASSRSGRGCRRSSRRSRRASARRTRSAVSSGTAGLHLALRAVGVQRGRRGRHAPVLVRRLGQRVLFERARPVFADIDPVTLNLDPEAARGRGDRAHDARCCPCTSSASPPTCRRSSRFGAADRRGRLRGAGRRARRRRRRSAARGHPAVFGFYANKQLTTGEGGMVTLGDGALKERIDSERNQGRAPDMGWLDHDRLGFNYRLERHRLRARARPARAARRDARRRARAVAALVRARRSPGIEGLGLPVRRARRRPARLVRLRRAGAARRPDRDDVVVALRERGIQSKPYLPAIHLMSFYRERFGHREGEFPVCEDVAARSIALPFFPEMTQAQVERGRASALRSASCARSIIRAWPPVPWVAISCRASALGASARWASRSRCALPFALWHTRDRRHRPRRASTSRYLVMELVAVAADGARAARASRT